MSSAPPRWSPQAKRSSEVTPPERRAPGKNVKLTMAVVEGDHTKKLARPPNGKKESSTKPKVGSHYVHGDHGGARGASFTVPKRRLSLPFAGAEAAAATAASLIEVVKDVPLTLAEEETLRVKFNEFDLNGDGSLDKQEIANLLRVCDRYTNDDAVEALVDAVDDNGTHIAQLPARTHTAACFTHHFVPTTGAGRIQLRELLDYMRATPTPKHSAEEFACASLFTSVALGAPTPALLEPTPDAKVKPEDLDRLLAESFDLPEGALTDLLDPKERASLSVHDLTKLLLNAPAQ